MSGSLRKVRSSEMANGATRLPTPNVVAIYAAWLRAAGNRRHKTPNGSGNLSRRQAASSSTWPATNDCFIDRFTDGFTD